MRIRSRVCFTGHAFECHQICRCSRWAHKSASATGLAELHSYCCSDIAHGLVARNSGACGLLVIRRRKERPIDAAIENRTVDDLADRDALAAAALKVIGLVPSSYSRGTTAGIIAERRLEGCDLRKWKISGARFEVVSFSRSYLWDSVFVDCEFVKCVFGHVDWAGVKLLRVHFVDCDLSFTNLKSALGSEVRAKGCIGLKDGDLPEWVSVD